MSTEPPEHSNVALEANIAGQNRRSLNRYLAAAPHLKYPHLVRTYDQMVEAALRAAAAPPTSLRVCELGAGHGLSAIPWLKRQIPLTAVDPSEVMLHELKARVRGAPMTMVVSDAETFLAETAERFDILACVSMLHHIPDYLAMLSRTQAVLSAGGSLLIFQEPLRYDRMESLVHMADRAFYFQWRLGRGELRRGLRTRWRRLRRRYDAAEAVDFEEYHVVRNGVDSGAILDVLQPRFNHVTEIHYWANQSPVGQFIGDRLGMKNTFGILATGARGARG